MKTEKEYNIYFKTISGHFRIWNSSTKLIKTVSYKELPKKQCYAMLSFAGHKGNDDDLVRYSADFKIWIDELKKNDIYKINWLSFNHNNTACQLVFHNLAKGKYEDHDKIDRIEAKWMRRTHNGALTYCKPQTTESFSYDYSLFYPRIYAGRKFYIPDKRGKECTLKELPDMADLKLGYYRVKITCESDDFKKLFAFSKDHTYTDKSLYQAVRYKEEYDVKINLIHDDEPNAYIYDSFVTGYSIFNKWYETICDLRALFPKNILIKFLASSLSGQLSKKYKIYKTYDEIQDEELDVGIDDSHRYEIVANKFNYIDGEETEYYELIDTDNQYKFNMRLMPFLTAFARNKISRLANKDIDNLVRIHTDSCTFSREQVFDKQHTILDYSTLKLEKKTSGLVEWTNVNNYKKL